LSAACWTSRAWFAPFGSAVYWSLTLSFLAASSAPLRTWSQKVSPGAAWVTIATVISSVPAPPPPPPPPSVSSFPPVDDPPASASAATAAVVMTAGRVKRDMVGAFLCVRRDAATERSGTVPGPGAADSVVSVAPRPVGRGEVGPLALLVSDVLLAGAAGARQLADLADRHVPPGLRVRGGHARVGAHVDEHRAAVGRCPLRLPDGRGEALLVGHL